MTMRQTSTSLTILVPEPSVQLRSKAVQIAPASSIDPCYLVNLEILRSPDLKVIVSGPFLALCSIAYLEADAVTLTIPLSTNLVNHSCPRFAVCLLWRQRLAPFYPRSDTALDRLLCSQRLQGCQAGAALT